MLLQYKPTRVQEITGHPVIKKAGVRLLIKREDMNHPFVSGNKWWKLKYNIANALNQSCETILTFGGAYSNHIYATAAAAGELRLKSIGVIRGEETRPLNATLSFAIDQGMQLFYVSRAEYKEKNDPLFIRKLHQLFGGFYHIPEGGSNLPAVKGCAEFAVEHLSQISFDHLLLPVGTGGTLAGIVAGFGGNKKITGVSVLKGEGSLKKDIEHMIKEFSGASFGNWSLLTRYHEGGYAKVTTQLLSLMEEMNAVYHLPLDHVYTGKLLLAVIREIEAGSFRRGTTILVVHTGGLQGVSSRRP